MCQEARVIKMLGHAPAATGVPATAVHAPQQQVMSPAAPQQQQPYPTAAPGYPPAQAPAQPSGFYPPPPV